LDLDDLCKLKDLTRYQKLVIKQLMSSQSVKSISSTLHKSPSVIKYHIWNIYKIFGVQTRYELIAEITKMLNKYSNTDHESLHQTVEQLKKDVAYLKSQLNNTGLTLPIGIKSNT
jgi:DNA-binding CsgD family transcriptional regulator